MIVIVPKKSRFKKVEAGLSPELLERVFFTAGGRSATVSMPRFEFESGLDLAGLLAKMGMADAFQPERANFGGIAKGRELYISAALHRATIAVDEGGTEATAATAIVGGEVSLRAGPPPLHLTIDRPFIFAIVERQTGAILFLGRVTNPSRQLPE